MIDPRARPQIAAVVALAAVAAIAPSRAEDAAGKDAPQKRELDPDSPQAKALGELLFVEANYGKDRRVELEYAFNEPAQAEDFEVRGFDKAEVNTSYSQGFELGVGSRGQGLMLHVLPLKGDFTVEYRLRLEWIAPSSQLVFVFADGKSGGQWGPYFSKRTSRGYKPLARMPIDRSKVGSGRDVTVRYEVADGEITCWVDKIKLAETGKLSKKLDGRIGLYMTNIRVVLTGLSIHGEIDPAGL